MQLRTVNNVFSTDKRPVKLYRGAGYHYFEYDDGNHYETYSVMCPRLNDLSLAQWVGIGNRFANAVRDGTFNARWSD